MMALSRREGSDMSLEALGKDVVSAVDALRGDFQATAELSRLAVAKTGEVPPIQHPHAHAGCGCT